MAILPDDTFYRAWDFIMTACVVFIALESPFELCFIPDNVFHIMQWVNFVVTICFVIDMIVTWRLAYHFNGILIHDPALIRQRYLRRWFLVDFISLGPSIIFLAFETPIIHRSFKDLPRAINLLNLIRLWRLARISDNFYRLEKNLGYYYFYVRCIKIACVTYLTVHSAACIFYWIALGDENNSWISQIPVAIGINLLKRYIVALYWACTTFTTIGYGNYHPVKDGEMLYCNICMLINLGLSAYVLGNLGNLVVSERTKKNQSRLANLRNPMMCKVLEEITVNGWDYSTCLYHAALRGDAVLVDMLLQQKNIRVEWMNVRQRTPLLAACSIGCEDSVRYLLKFGANAYHRDIDNNAPLWEALRGGHRAVVKLLMAYNIMFTEQQSAEYIAIANQLENDALAAAVVEYTIQR